MAFDEKTNRRAEVSVTESIADHLDDLNRRLTQLEVRPTPRVGEPNLATASIKGKGHIKSRPLSDHLDSVNVKAFGAIGNGALNYLSSMFATLAEAQVVYPKATSLDDTADWAGIQQAVDYALANAVQKVIMPDGVYVTSDTIHLGYGFINGGANFQTVVLEGIGMVAVAGVASGVEIRCLFKDRPVINIQGGRRSGVRNLAITGQCPLPIHPFGMTLAQRRVAANYVVAGTKDDRNQPHCGVAIDGYSGYQIVPENPYPVPRYSALAGTPSPNPWSAAMSSRWFVENCSIYGTHIGVACQPYQDGNGDFGSLRGSGFVQQKIGVAVGNSQARNMDFDNTTFDELHTCVDGTSYGHGVGNLQGSWNNIACNAIYRLLHGAGGWSQPIYINNFYVESGMIIGDLDGTAVSFESGTFSVADALSETLFKSISTITWSGGIATVTVLAGSELSTWGAHGWRSGDYPLAIVGAATAFNATVSGTWLSNTQFTYPLAADPGAYPGGAAVQIQAISEWANEPIYRGNVTLRNCNFSGRHIYHFSLANGKPNFFNCSFAKPYPGHGPMPPDMQKALSTFGNVIIDLNEDTRGGESPFSGENALQGFGSDYGTQPLQQFSTDGYNTGRGRTLWGVGQKGAGYSYLYDVVGVRYDLVFPQWGALSGVTRIFTPDGSIAGTADVGDVLYCVRHSNYYVESVGGSPDYLMTCKALTWFRLIGGVFSQYTNDDIDWGKNQDNPALDYNPSALPANGNTAYYPAGVMDLEPSTTASGVWGWYPDGLFMKTTLGSDVIEIISYAGDVETPALRPSHMTAKSKPLWTGSSARPGGNLMPFPQHTTIDLATPFPTASSVKMTKLAVRSGVWSYGPGIKFIK
jgi:hypothetical protein